MTASGIHRSLPPEFELVREIGSGATSVVYEAVQRSTSRAVAVKMLTFALTDGTSRRRFAQECATMAALATHPNIVSIIDAGIHEERPWIAMELCRGGSLANAGALPFVQVLDVLVAVADAMEAAHRLGIVHCDLKPGNVLLTDFGAPAVADFGIARPTSTAATVVGSGYSLDHAAPEVLDGREPTAETDIYCLGTTIWTLLSGRSPFGDSATTPASAIAKRILLDPFPSAPDQTPPALAELITAMTAKAPADRSVTMAEIAGRARDIRAPLAPGRSPRPTPFPGRIGPVPAAREPMDDVATTHHPQPTGAAAAPEPAAAGDDHPAPTAPTTHLVPTPAPTDQTAPTGVGRQAQPLGPRIAGAVLGAYRRRGEVLPAVRGALRRRPPYLPLVVLAAALTTMIAGIAVAVSADPARPGDPGPQGAPETAAPVSPTVDALGLKGMELNPPCDGKFVVIVGSAVTPGRYAADVARLLSTAPGAHYLETARSCGVFADHTASGALIYAIYLGPYGTLGDACAARARTGVGAVVQQLNPQPSGRHPSC